LSKELLEETGALMVHARKVLNNAQFIGKYGLVIDCSFCSSQAEYFASIKALVQNLNHFLRPE